MTATAQRPYFVDSLELAGIKLDRACQPRAAINEALVVEYGEAMREGDVFPPIVVFFDGADHWLADGFHRYHAARRADQYFFSAELHTGTRRDAILHSVSANTSHGARRTNTDKRRAVETLLADEEWARWTDREIARQCGVAHTFVADVGRSFAGSRRPTGVRPLVPDSSDEASPAAPQPATEKRRYVNKHGQEAEMNVANIGRTKHSFSDATAESSTGSGLAPTQKRLAVEAALRNDPRGGSAAIAKMVGCTAAFVSEVRAALNVPTSKVQSPSAKMRAERFDQATSTLETSGEWLEAQEIDDFADDPRLSRWLDRLTRAIASMRRVRGTLEEIRERLNVEEE